MSDERTTQPPPPPEMEDDVAEQARVLTELLKHHPDPQVRMLVIISDRIFTAVELSADAASTSRAVSTRVQALEEAVGGGFNTVLESLNEIRGALKLPLHRTTLHALKQTSEEGEVGLVRKTAP